MSVFCIYFWGARAAESRRRDKLTWEKLMKLEKEYFGQTRDGADVQRYRLTHPRGASVALIEYGAIVQSVRAPDRDGQMDEISLGFDKLDGYLGEHPYFGATVGRYANRIASGAFSLEGESYSPVSYTHLRAHET